MGQFFFNVRVSIRTCVPNLGGIRRERFLTIYNPLNPPRGGVGQIFFEVSIYIRTCVQKIWARCGPTARSDGQVYNRTKVRTHEGTDTGTKVRTHAQ